MHPRTLGLGGEREPQTSHMLLSELEPLQGEQAALPARTDLVTLACDLAARRGLCSWLHLPQVMLLCTELADGGSKTTNSLFPMSFNTDT